MKPTPPKKLTAEEFASVLDLISKAEHEDWYRRAEVDLEIDPVIVERLLRVAHERLRQLAVLEGFDSRTALAGDAAQLVIPGDTYFGAIKSARAALWSAVEDLIAFAESGRARGCDTPEGLRRFFGRVPMLHEAQRSLGYEDGIAQFVEGGAFASEIQKGEETPSDKATDRDPHGVPTFRGRCLICYTGFGRPFRSERLKFIPKGEEWVLCDGCQEAASFLSATVASIDPRLLSFAMLNLLRDIAERAPKDPSMRWIRTEWKPAWGPVPDAIGVELIAHYLQFELPDCYARAVTASQKMEIMTDELVALILTEGRVKGM